MTSDPVFFRAIHLDLPLDAIYRRLGYRKAHTRVSPERLREVQTALEDAADIVELRGSAVIIPAGVSPGEVVLGTGEVLRSRGLAGMLAGSCQVLFMGATAGSRIVEEIGESTQEGELSRAVVLDAAASEMTDTALDWICAHVARQIRREGLELTTRRFSAGYGDFALENQKVLYERLRLQEIGVEITDSCILVPEKSVTAVAGIREGA